jgi:hypothetical protein
MSNYSQTTNFTAKDALLSGNPAKLIKGADFDVEFAAIAAAIATKLDSSNAANPSASVGLAAVNGSAGTYMRSDGAPALSQAIVPTWTGIHTFSAKPVLSAGFTANASSSVTGVSGIALAVSGVASQNILSLTSGSAFNVSIPDLLINRNGSTANVVEQGPAIQLFDTGAGTASAIQHSGGQTEFWQFNGSWVQTHRVTSTDILQCVDAGGTMQDVGFKNLPGNVKNANYTLVIGDSGKVIINTSGGPFTYTIPSNASVAYPVGTVLTFMGVSGSSLSIAINSDTMVLAGTGGTVGTRTLVNSGIATAIKSQATQWIISGTGLS